MTQSKDEWIQSCKDCVMFLEHSKTLGVCMSKWCLTKPENKCTGKKISKTVINTTIDDWCEMEGSQ